MEEVKAHNISPSNITALSRVRDEIQGKRQSLQGKFQAQVSEERFKEFHVFFNDGTEGTIPYDMLMDSRCIRNNGVLILRVFRRFIGLKGTRVHEIDAKLRRQELTILQANAKDHLHIFIEQHLPTIQIISETRSEIQSWVSEYPSLREWMDL